MLQYQCLDTKYWLGLILFLTVDWIIEFPVLLDIVITDAENFALSLGFVIPVHVFFGFVIQKYTYLFKYTPIFSSAITKTISEKVSPLATSSRRHSTWKLISSARQIYWFLFYAIKTTPRQLCKELHDCRDGDID